MKFGPVPIADARDCVLAHSLQLGEVRLRKGRILDETDIALIADAGLAEVVVARLTQDDVHEDAAATQLAQALIAGQTGLFLGAAGTGRVNIFATEAGVAKVDAERIHAANSIDLMITTATVPPFQRVAEGGMVATVKIISYAVPSDTLAEACAAGKGALGAASAQFKSACLVQTLIGSEAPGKGHKVLSDRLKRLGVALAPLVTVSHEETAVAEALMQAEAEVLFVLTGSATSDIGDVAPSALLSAGGHLEAYGMPVDPGNLLFIGALNGKPVIGLPGCARSPALNGADWVLERVVCGIPVRKEDIMRMGVGGLLKEIPSRPQPRQGQR